MCPYRSIARVGTVCGVYFKPHVLRRTFINLSRTIDVQATEVETLLNHAPGFESASVYDTAVGEERLRPVMQAITNAICVHAQVRKRFVLK